VHAAVVERVRRVTEELAIERAGVETGIVLAGTVLRAGTLSRLAIFWNWRMRSACWAGSSVSCVRSPVNRIRSGVCGSRFTISTARSKARLPVGLAGPLNPTWVSLSWTKENGVTLSPFLRASSLATSSAAPPDAKAGATR